VPRGIQIDPPILISQTAGVAFALSTIEQVIDYVRRYGEPKGWKRLRDAAFVAAAVQTPDSIETVRHLAQEAFEKQAAAQRN
jgi:hypothetical protein